MPAGSITSNTFSTFSDFVLANLTDGPLPVTLLSFNGNLINHSVQLNWKVENEQKFDRYEIERGINGSAFTKIGFVNARGVSTDSTYPFTDLQVPNSPELFYRLKMVDKDGRFTYSNTIRLKLIGSLNNRIITIAPNPFANSLSIKLQSAGNQNIQLQLSEINGKLLKHKQHNLIQGIDQLNFQAGDLRKGVYVLKLLTTGGLITEKVIKQ